MQTSDAFDAAVCDHDARLAASGLVIWVGSEPTFTDRHAQTPHWLNQALGGDKLARAEAVLRALCMRWPGALVLRCTGRRYPGEDEPRWCLGLFRRRDGVPIWSGPPDPVLSAEAAGPLVDLDAFAAALDAELAARGLSEHHTAVSNRAAVAGPVPAVELATFATVTDYLAAIDALAVACRACGVGQLVISGALPPVDATVELTTLTPDPAVVEINTAPSTDAADFLARSRSIYAAAEAEGLAPYRLYFNGAVADSGGGGQITLGGPTPEASPFLLVPQTLPRLVGFFNRHPALSYLYSHDHVGSSGQSARPDERGSDALDELRLALAWLADAPAGTPQDLWQRLAPFLCDASGNSHRAEVNIEKLWNPHAGERGMLGLVEFRALRMQHSPERATALACLLRAIVALLATAPPPEALTLVDWGRALHDRFALPFYLEQDLRQVLATLDASGFGLGRDIEALLLRDEFRLMGEVSLPGCRVEIRRALEFWPLLGDAASPEQAGTSRLVDASTARVELRLRPEPGDAAHWQNWQAWQCVAEGQILPMAEDADAQGPVRVFGLRYRSFVPRPGLHPNLPAQTPLRLLLRHADRDDDLCVTLHEWQPDGEAYPGLPDDLEQADRRRAERITLAVGERDASLAPRPAGGPGLSACSLDLRHPAPGPPSDG
jgi:uncharacterized protein (DUF2126 family)